MKIFIICSKVFYELIPDILHQLEKAGHKITLPNHYETPWSENLVRGTKDHAEWKAELIRLSETKIKEIDCVLVLNYNKSVQLKNYIGGCTFLEMYDAFRMGKKIYMMNDIPEGLLKDEIIGFSPIILNGDLSKIE